MDVHDRTLRVSLTNFFVEVRGFDFGETIVTLVKKEKITTNSSSNGSTAATKNMTTSR